MADDDKGTEGVQFTPEQQAFIGELVARKYEEAFQKAGAEFKARDDKASLKMQAALDAKDAEIAKLTEAAEKAGGTNGVNKGEFTQEDVQKLVDERLAPVLDAHKKETEQFQSQLEVFQTRAASLQAAITSSAIENAAHKAEALIPDIVHLLPEVQGKVAVNSDGVAFVVGEDGKTPATKIDGQGREQQITVTDLISGVLEKRPDLRKGAAFAGAGSTGNTNGAGVGKHETPSQMVNRGLRELTGSK